MRIYLSYYYNELHNQHAYDVRCSWDACLAYAALANDCDAVCADANLMRPYIFPK